MLPNMSVSGESMLMTCWMCVAWSECSVGVNILTFARLSGMVLSSENGGCQHEPHFVSQNFLMLPIATDDTLGYLEFCG